MSVVCIVGVVHSVCGLVSITLGPAIADNDSWSIMCRRSGQAGMGAPLSAAAFAH